MIFLIFKNDQLNLLYTKNTRTDSAYSSLIFYGIFFNVFTKNGSKKEGSHIASIDLGTAVYSIQKSKDWMWQRKQFGKTLNKFYHLQFEMVNMAKNLVASRLMIRHASKKVEDGHPDKTMYCTMAKLFASEKRVEIRVLPPLGFLGNYLGFLGFQKNLGLISLGTQDSLGKYIGFIK